MCRMCRARQFLTTASAAEGGLCRSARRLHAAQLRKLHQYRPPRPAAYLLLLAYAQLAASGAISVGDKVDFIVPTGNFGDILAGYYARLLGLPVGRLVCASNENNVLADFIRTGVYDARRPFIRTTSPSMDILVSLKGFCSSPPAATAPPSPAGWRRCGATGVQRGCRHACQYPRRLFRGLRFGG